MDNNQVQRIKELFNLAVKNHTSNNIEEAQKLYKEVLKINPNHSNALNNLGIISYNLGDNRKAVNYYEKAISLPIFPILTENEQSYVIETVKKLCDD